MSRREVGRVTSGKRRQFLIARSKNRAKGTFARVDENLARTKYLHTCANVTEYRAQLHEWAFVSPRLIVRESERSVSPDF